MTIIRSPSYPSMSLPEALAAVAKIHDNERSMPVDRTTAAGHLGYSSLSGPANKALAALGSYGLTERVGKGEIRVSDRAVGILHPRTEDERRANLVSAAWEPDLFQSLRARYPGGMPSEANLRSYLMRENFSGTAIGPAVKAFLQTFAYLEEQGVSDSRGALFAPDPESDDQGAVKAKPADVQRAPFQPPPPPPPAVKNEGVKLMDAERVVFVEESTPSKYLKVIASGEIDSSLVEALEDYVKRLKRRSASTPPSGEDKPN